MARGGARAGAGRKPKPQAGNVSRLPVNNKRAAAAAADDGDLVKELPGAPDHMEDAAQTVWLEIMGLLVGAGIIRRRDLFLVEALAEAVVVRRMAMRELVQLGINIENTKGGFSKNPAATVVNEQSGRIQSLGAELGMTPSARARLQGSNGGKAKADDFADF